MAKSVKHPVIWNGVVVGEIENISCDNFNVFGKWYPGDSPATAHFYEELKVGRELRIKIGDVMEGRIDEPPEGELEFKIVPKSQPNE